MMGVVIFCVGCLVGFLIGVLLDHLGGGHPPDDYLDGSFEQL